MSKYLTLILFCFLILGLSNNASAQCDQALIDNCASGSGNIKYIKHFRIRFAESKNAKNRSEGKFVMMLSKGNHYRFSVCNDPSKPGSTIIELNSDYSKFGGNYNAETDKEYKAFDFMCTKTGPYYLTMYFKDGQEGCGVCVVSLVTD
ncbi:MAG: hypothetical protein AB7E36_02950 [Salinivirgaceae bacterium]